MRIFVMILNLFLGGWMFVINFQPYNLKPTYVLGLLVAMLWIFVAIMFYRRQAWAAYFLPAIPLLLSLYLFFAVSQFKTPSEGAWVAGPMILFALIFFVFGLLEGWYTIRHRS